MQHTPSIPFLKRITRFSITGGSSTVVHFCCVLLLVSLLRMHPLSANIIAFLTAFSISYLGHSRWTFADMQQTAQNKTLPRYFIVAIFSFCLNESMYGYLLHAFHMPYLLALLIVLGTVSAITFTLSKFWVFR